MRRNMRPPPREEGRIITYIYNTMLNFISMSFRTAYIIVTFRVRVRVRVELYFGTGNLNHI